MLRFLKMDLIAACVAVTSLFGLARFHTLSATPVNPSDASAPIVAKAFVAPTVPAKPVMVVKKLAKPFGILANLGKASWYGSVLDGHRTASGEIFHKDELTACHRTLPFGTMVKVVDVTNGRSVVVRINDRGVLDADRIIDLSSGAAQSLGILRAGVARVRLEVLKAVVATPKTLVAEERAVLPDPL